MQLYLRRSVAVVTGAAPLSSSAASQVEKDWEVIAADGGLDHALAAGLTPQLLVGDLDSVSPEGLRWAQQHCVISRFDTDKDATDTELALDAAADLNPQHVMLISGGGDRLDHTLGVIGALARPSMTSVPVLDGWWAQQYFRVQHGPGEAVFEDLPIGSSLSLIATAGSCEGVSIDGVRWPLADSTLAPLSGLGVSNEVTESTVRVSVRTGVLTVWLIDTTQS